MALGMWALRKLTTTDFSAIQDLENLELQIRGLSRLAGLSYEEATMSIRHAWTASVAGSRSYTSPGDASADRVASLGAAAPAQGGSPAGAGGSVEFLAAAGAGEALATDSRLLAIRTAGGWIPSVLRVRRARACLGRCRKKGRRGPGRVSRLQKGRKRTLLRSERKPLPLQSLAPLREERRLRVKSFTRKCSR